MATWRERLRHTFTRGVNMCLCSKISLPAAIVHIVYVWADSARRTSYSALCHAAVVSIMVQSWWWLIAAAHVLPIYSTTSRDEPDGTRLTSSAHGESMPNGSQFLTTYGIVSLTLCCMPQFVTYNIQHTTYNTQKTAVLLDIQFEHRYCGYAYLPHFIIRRR